MRTAEFFYPLPPELIAQTPAEKRDGSRLLVLNRSNGQIQHRQFTALAEYLQAGDVLVLNNSRVIPARVRGMNPQTGGRSEMLLIEELAVNDWWAMMKPGKRARPGTRITILDLKGGPTGISATVAEVNAEGHRRLVFTGTEEIREALDLIGEVPLPPYIVRPGRERQQEGGVNQLLASVPPHPGPLPRGEGELPSDLAESDEGSGRGATGKRSAALLLPHSGTATVVQVDDKLRYQTVYADPPGSVAAPTAGLHFTAELLDKIRAQGVIVCFVTLHVGPGTFAPVKAENIEEHVMHEEWMEIGDATVKAIRAAKAAGRRVIAAGTTSVRVLESVAALHGGALQAHTGKTRIFIHPPYDFKVVDALLTNFHLPGSTLLMLVSAFAAPGAVSGREMMLDAYAEAVRERYRFFSYGDVMLIG